MAWSCSVEVEKLHGKWKGEVFTEHYMIIGIIVHFVYFVLFMQPVVTLSGEDLVWESSPIKSNFLSGVHEFGHQKVHWP